MLISLHGGHSGEFCNHASDTLEDLILKYIELGFTHVGISEHMPPVSEELMYVDEREKGLTPEQLMDRFESYIKTGKSLKYKYRSSIKIYIGLETETYTGYESHISNIIDRHKPDYMVGSVHHVNDLCFDYSKEFYEKAVESCGGINKFYEEYFDLQYEMISKIKPQVVGHFDLARIFDAEYEKRLSNKNIKKKIRRNLELIKKNNLIIDYNQRALLKNMKEPYPAKNILKDILDLGISIVPGDDSHDVSSVGYKINSAMDYLLDQGVEFNNKIFGNFY